MDTYLAPIEKPSSFVMKLAYYFTRREFGKVLTPLKVHSARLPAAFAQTPALSSPGSSGFTPLLVLCGYPAPNLA